MTRRRRSPDRVLARDDAGRPTEVQFDGDPAAQCPACLSTAVEPWGGIGFLPVGDRILDANMAPIRRMRCRSCGGRWVRPGL